MAGRCSLLFLCCDGHFVWGCCAARQGIIVIPTVIVNTMYICKHIGPIFWVSFATPYARDIRPNKGMSSTLITTPDSKLIFDFIRSRAGPCEHTYPPRKVNVPFRNLRRSWVRSAEWDVPLIQDGHGGQIRPSCNWPDKPEPGDVPRPGIARDGSGGWSVEGEGEGEGQVGSLQGQGVATVDGCGLRWKNVGLVLEWRCSNATLHYVSLWAV